MAGWWQRVTQQCRDSKIGPAEQIFTPDDIMAGRLPTAPTLIFDDDHYYMASVIAEVLRQNQVPVTLVTPGKHGFSLG